MKQAIKILSTRINILYQEIEWCEKQMEEAEMVCAIEFAMTDINNFKREIEELQEAIKILNNHQIKVK